MARTLSGDRAGFWPARISPIWAIARVPLSTPPRPWKPFMAAGRTSNSENLAAEAGPVAQSSAARDPVGSASNHRGSSPGGCDETGDRAGDGEGVALRVGLASEEHA